MITVTDASYPREVLQNPLPMVVVFGTYEDLGSRVLGPVLLEVEQELTVGAQIAIADVAACPKTAAAWGVGDRLPVILILRSGVLERVLHGVRSKTRLLKDITDALT